MENSEKTHEGVSHSSLYVIYSKLTTPILCTILGNLEDAYHGSPVEDLLSDRKGKDCTLFSLFRIEKKMGRNGHLTDRDRTFVLMKPEFYEFLKENKFEELKSKHNIGISHYYIRPKNHPNNSETTNLHLTIPRFWKNDRAEYCLSNLLNNLMLFLKGDVSFKVDVKSRHTGETVGFAIIYTNKINDINDIIALKIMLHHFDFENNFTSLCKWRHKLPKNQDRVHVVKNKKFQVKRSFKPTVPIYKHQK
jgi:hypothetical protein